jgi:hypothetical protein
VNGSDRHSQSWLLEAYGPAVCGLLTLAVLYWQRANILPLMTGDKISVSNLCSAIFGWASIQTGCVFAIYGFIAGKTDGFIGEARNTRSMKRYTVYIKRAIWTGFLLTLTSMPLIVWKFAPEQIGNVTFLIFSLWFSIFVWAFLSFARVAFIFGILIQINESTKIGAG